MCAEHLLGGWLHPRFHEDSKIGKARGTSKSLNDLEGGDMVITGAGLAVGLCALYYHAPKHKETARDVCKTESGMGSGAGD